MKVKLLNLARKNLIKTLVLFGLVMSVGVSEVRASQYSGTLAADSPSYFMSGSAYYYANYTFTANSTDSYRFNISSAASDADPFINLYSSSGFDPSNESTNRAAQLGDGDSYLLTNGTRYTALVSLGSNVTGAYTFTITPSVSSLAQNNITGSSTSLNSSAIRSSGNIHNSPGSTALTFNNSQNVFYNYAIDNTITNFIKSSAGILTLAGANTYTESTTISGGTLSLAKDAILSTSTIHLSGGKLGAAASFTLANPIFLDTSGIIDTQGQNLVLSGPISGSYIDGLTKTGAGTLTIIGDPKTYSGTTTVSEGTLKLSIAPNGQKITFNGGSFKAGAALSLANDIAVESATNFDTNNNNVTLTGAISGSGTFTKKGLGTLTLNNAANSQIGTIAVDQGTLVITQWGDIDATSSMTISNGATFKTATSDIVLLKGIAMGSGGGGKIDPNGRIISFSSGTAALTGSNQMEVYDSSADGDGTFDVTGLPVGNVFPGTTKITKGKYKINANAQLGTGGTPILNGGTLQLGGSITSSFPTISLAASSNIDTYGNTLNINTITSTDTSNILNIQSSSGNGILDMTAVTSFTGVTKITSGSLLINSAANLGTGGASILNGGTLKLAVGGLTLPAISMTNSSTIDIGSYNLTMANAITHSTSGQTFTKAGAGTMTMSATNSFNNAKINVAAGTMVLTNIANQLSGVAYMQLGNGTTLSVSGGGSLPPLVL